MIHFDAAHVIADATSVTATFSSGEELNALGAIDTDEKTDVALIRINATKHPMLALVTQLPAKGGG